MSDPSGVPTPTAKIRTPASAAALLPLCVAEKLFAVRENDYRSIADRALAECLHGQINRARDICSAFGNRVGVEIVDRLDGGVVINRQRRLHERATGERNQANPVPCSSVMRSCVANFTRWRRFGGTSFESMLRDVSTARMRSSPFRFASS